MWKRSWRAVTATEALAAFGPALPTAARNWIEGTLSTVEIGGDIAGLPDVDDLVRAARNLCGGTNRDGSEPPSRSAMDILRGYNEDR